MQVVTILISLVMCSSFVAATCLLSSWLALGRTPLPFRMPIFLVGTLFLGWLVTLLVSRHTESLFCTLGAMVMWLGSYLAKSYISRGLFVAMGGVMFCAPLLALRGTELDTSWIARVALATSLMAFALSSLRWLDYRLVRLATGVDRLSLDIATGRSLDEWLWELDRHEGRSKNHAQLRGFLREQGMVEHWQKIITEAYQRSIGQRPVLCAVTSDELFVIDNPPAAGELMQRFRAQRFQIRDMLLASFAVACVAAFLKWFPSYRPQTLDFTAGVPITLILAAATLIALVASLTPAARRPWRPLLWGTFLIAVMFAVLQWIGLAMNYKLALLLMAAIALGAMCLMSLALFALRQRGYRLARVSPRRVPAAPSEAS